MKKKQTLHWRSILRHYWPFVRARWRTHVTLLVLFGAASFITATASPLIYKEMVDAISAGQPGTYDTLLQLLFYLALSIVLYNLLFRIADRMEVRTQSNVLKKLYEYAFANLEKKSHQFYMNSFTGGLVAKTKRFVRAFENLYDQLLYHVWMNGIMLISSVVVLWYQSWQLGAIFMVWLAGYAILVRYMVRWSIPKSLEYAESDSKVTASLADALTNILTVKMFGAEEREKRRFEQVTTYENDKRIAAWMQNGFWNNMYQGVAVGVYEIAIVAAAIILWGEGLASPGLLLLVVVYVHRSFNIVWSLSRNVINFMTAMTDANEMVEILDQPVHVTDPAKPQSVKIEQGHVMLHDVRLTYDTSGHVFDGLNLDIQPGERVALVGHSGTGKTTIVKLLLRFIDGTEGAVLIDGQDVRQVRQADLRRRIAYVPQEPLLFHRSLFENIAYGKTDATQEEVEEVARRAHAHEFISRLSQGYETLVGERGVKLSGGERQRVAIARALLKDAPIVILDEAASSLDSVSERHIQEAFDELMAGRTTIVIAHRLSTIQHMDRIIVLENGGVAEQGTHGALLQANGVYAELWNSQVGGFIADS